MDDMNDNGGNFVPDFPINFRDLAYAAPILGAGLLVCFTVSLCCYLCRRVIAPQHYSNSFESSSRSFRNHQRPSQAQRQRTENQMAGGSRNYPRIGHQFVSWAREHMRNPVRDNHTPASSNLLSPMEAQYPRATQGREGNGLYPSRPRTTAGASNALLDSGGFSRATAPPPCYSNAAGYPNAPTWNLPGYGYQSTDQRTRADGGEMAQDGINVLPPPYDAVVGDGQDIRRT